jgi:hypothetical protein
MYQNTVTEYIFAENIGKSAKSLVHYKLHTPTAHSDLALAVVWKGTNHGDKHCLYTGNVTWTETKCPDSNRTRPYRRISNLQCFETDTNTFHWFEVILILLYVCLWPSLARYIFINCDIQNSKILFLFLRFASYCVYIFKVLCTVT